jgi:hypothetical protein
MRNLFMNIFLSTETQTIMNERLTRKLLDDFPKLYRDRNDTPMQRGFACGDGWFDLIYKLSHDIEAVAREIGLQPDTPAWPKCLQVKEKLGGIRYRIFNCTNDHISELIDSAYEQSLKTCEYCGKTGKLITDGRITTMCPEHASAPSDRFSTDLRCFRT